MRLALGVCALLLVGCASRGVAPQLAAELGRAHALLHDGCYRCLQDALDIYERTAAARNAPLDAARGALHAAVLLAARARELGLPDEAPLALARAWADRLPPSPVPSSRLPAHVYLDALELVEGESSGLVAEERERGAATGARSGPSQATSRTRGWRSRLPSPSTSSPSTSRWPSTAVMRARARPSITRRSSPGIRNR
jgi:hypothetical protein